ncbi:GNAT family N-acetyltransferase, partial [Planktotalea sp.]|uniref:GNAT family N-acetyltransferase n=1 Tax=Planktotalea sp. TaxID=2029877 RepID=UPI0032973C33
GVGRALMAAACDFAELNRCSTVTLGVMAQNTAARGFYERLGFDLQAGNGALKLRRELGLQSA